jgi:hypothetical protein
MKRFLSILLAAASAIQMSGQTYVGGYNLDTVLQQSVSIPTASGNYRIYQTSQQEHNKYIEVRRGDNQTIYIEKIKLSTNLAFATISATAATNLKIVVRGRNSVTTMSSSEAINLNIISNRAAIWGGLLDTLEAAGSTSAAAIHIRTGSQANSAIVFNGGTILTSGGASAIYNEPDGMNRTYFDTIIINKGLITGKTAANNIGIGPGGEYSKYIVINGGSVDALSAETIRINGGSVKGPISQSGSGGGTIRNSAGDSVFVGVINKPKVEGVWVDGRNYNIRRNHRGSGDLFLFMSHANENDTMHIVEVIADGVYTKDTAWWDGAQHKFVFGTLTQPLDREVHTISITSANLTRTYNSAAATGVDYWAQATGNYSAVSVPLPYDMEPEEIVVRFNGKIVSREPYSVLTNKNFSINAADIAGMPVGNYPIQISYSGSKTNAPITWDTFLTIEKAMPAYTLPDTLTAQFMDSCHNVSLAAYSGWTWLNPNDTVGFPGYRRRAARYTPVDTNYVNVDTFIVIKVGKRTPPLPPPTERVAVRNDSLINIVFTNSCWKWLDSTLLTGNTAGTRSFEALYLCDTQYYAFRNQMPINVLSEALPSATAVYLDTVGLSTLPANWTWLHGSDPVGNAGERYHYAIYNNGSYVKTKVKVVVGKRQPHYNTISCTATYGDALSSVVLWDTSAGNRPNLTHADTGWVWTNPAALVGNAGIRQCSARFTPLDPANWKTIDTTLSVKVNRKYPTYTLPTGLTATFGDTTGAVRPALTGDWKWKYPSDTVGYPGLRMRRALYLHDTANYEPVDTLLQIEVLRAHAAVPPAQSATYGDTLPSVLLPVPWVWKYPSQYVGNAGTRIHIAMVAYADTFNYFADTARISVTVAKAIPPHSIPSNLTAVYGDLVGGVPLWDTSRTNLTHADTGWSWTTPSRKVGNAGVQPHPAKFIPLDADNYLPIDTILEIIVKKAKPNPDMPAGLITAFVGDTLNDVSLPQRQLYMYEGSRLYGAWRWYYPDDPVGDMGDNYHSAVFTMEDTANWDTAMRMLKVFVAKKTEIFVSNATETLPLHYEIDGCFTNEVDVRFGTDDSVKVIYKSVSPAQYNDTALARYKGSAITELRLNVREPNVYTITYVLVTKVNGSPSEKEQTLYIMRKFVFADLVRKKYNRMMFVDNNPIRTGHHFVAYQWYRSGAPVGDGTQYYYEGTYDNAQVIAPTTPYSVTVTTDGGMQISTCEGYVTQTVQRLRLYPNPVRNGGSITLDLPAAMQSGEVITAKIFSITGVLQRECDLSYGASQIDIDLPPGIYVLKSRMGETFFVVE